MILYACPKFLSVMFVHSVTGKCTLKNIKFDLTTKVFKVFPFNSISIILDQIIKKKRKIHLMFGICLVHLIMTIELH